MQVTTFGRIIMLARIIHEADAAGKSRGVLVGMSAGGES